MFNLYSKGCRYAIRAIMKISPRERVEGFSLKSVCKKTKLPEPFTRKMFQALVRNGVLTARSGPGGGYRFRKDPSKISVLEIVHALDGKDAFDQCVIKDRHCGRTGHCAFHSQWMKSKAQLIEKLKGTAVAELVES